MKAQPSLKCETRRFTIKVPVYETRPVSPQSGEFIPKPPRTFSVQTEEKEETVEVSIPWEAIARTLGRQAVRNKSGRSTDGLVIVRHVRLKGGRK